MIDILFDQYQRYNNVANILNSLRIEGQVFNILEVGANEHQNLEKFLPNDQITYLDIQLPEDLQNNPKYILGDATAMSFLDNTYNVVVALDVFEHIAEMDREKFISEIHRVSSDFFVITAPFHSTRVVETEKRVNAVYKSIFNKDFIWLEEHMANGLPEIDKLSDYLISRDIHYKILSHGDLDIWETMMTIHFVAAQESRLGIYRNEIDRFYNQYIFENDFVEESYRKICIGSKQKEIPNLRVLDVDQTLKVQQLEKLRMLENKFYMLAGLDNSEETNTIKDFLQIFIDEGEGHQESNSIKIELENDFKHINAVFDSVVIKGLRIDPSNFKGAFEIRNLNLVTEMRELTKEEYSLSGNYNLKNGDVFVFYNDDPFVNINMSSEVSLKSISFDVIILNKDNAMISEIDQLNKRIIEIEEAANNKQEFLETDLVKVREQVTLLLQNNDTIEGVRNELVTKLENYKNKNKILQKNAEELQLECVRLQQENGSYRKELNSIYTSRGWKYLTGIKRILGK